MVAVEDVGSISPRDGLTQALEDLERRMIQAGLERTRGHRGQTADLLKISRWTLQRKMLKHNLVDLENED
jgi:DNA-binding NtrC family response regulator